MDFSKKLSFKSHYNKFSEINRNDNKDIYDLRKKKFNNLLYIDDYSYDAQIEYYENVYLKARQNNDEIYIKIETLSKLKNIIGFVRLTKLKNDKSFSWDSLIVSEKSPPWFALDITISMYAFGFNYLKKENCGLWVVPKEGDKVKKFHFKIGMAKILKEDEKFYYFDVKKNDFMKNYEYFKKMNIGIIKDFKLCN